jgi:hypothetical protein
MSYDYDAHEMLEAAIVALHKIANPIGSAVKYLEPGSELDTNWQYIVTSPSYITAVAEQAISKIADYQISAAPLAVMIQRFGRGRKYWRPGLGKDGGASEFAYVHEADNRIYIKRGLQAFCTPSADDLLASDWHLVVEGDAQ